MDFLSRLNASRDSSISTYHVFLLQYKSGADDVHVFVEGHDDISFYTHLIRRYIAPNRRIFMHECGNKRSVYETHQNIDRNIGTRKGQLFFVDKDLSDILGESYPSEMNIFVTEHYSIENYLVSEEMLFDVWNELFRFKETRVDFEIVREKFHEELRKFHEVAQSITVWIILVRRSGYRPSLDNIAFSKICFFDNEISFKVREVAVGANLVPLLEGLCKLTTPSEYSVTVSAIQMELSGMNPKSYIRGKFELWFFVNFVERLLKSLEDIGVKTKTQINESNAIEVLGPRLRPPSHLEEFIKSNV